MKVMSVDSCFTILNPAIVAMGTYISAFIWDSSRKGGGMCVVSEELGKRKKKKGKKGHSLKYSSLSRFSLLK